jgi:hypothetical protein
MSEHGHDKAPNAGKPPVNKASRSIIRYNTGTAPGSLLVLPPAAAGVIRTGSVVRCTAIHRNRKEVHRRGGEGGGKEWGERGRDAGACILLGYWLWL